MAQVLITGCSSGIGRSLAVALARRGDRVWGLARRAGPLKELQQELGPEKFSFSVSDVSRPEDVRAAGEAMKKAQFMPDIVILNAGINPEAMGTPFTFETFQKVLSINLFGVMSWLDYFLPDFEKRRRGHFVAISSLAAYRGDARWVSYCASKAALTRAFEALRGKYSFEGITFTTIHLGAVETGMGKASRSPFRLNPDQAAQKILRAMDRQASSVTIPPMLRVMLEMMRIFPDPLFSRIVSGAFGNPPEKAPRVAP
jgi:NAD(P)-dependent dehydrogenase (short-subunit alcohol dehydrogenase family)